MVELSDDTLAAIEKRDAWQRPLQERFAAERPDNRAVAMALVTSDDVRALLGECRRLRDALATSEMGRAEAIGAGLGESVRWRHEALACSNVCNRLYAERDAARAECDRLRAVEAAARVLRDAFGATAAHVVAHAGCDRGETCLVACALADAGADAADALWQTLGHEVRRG